MHHQLSSHASSTLLTCGHQLSSLAVITLFSLQALGFSLQALGFRL